MIIRLAIEKRKKYYNSLTFRASKLRDIQTQYFLDKRPRAGALYLVTTLTIFIHDKFP